MTNSPQVAWRNQQHHWSPALTRQPKAEKLRQTHWPHPHMAAFMVSCLRAAAAREGPDANTAPAEIRVIVGRTIVRRVCCVSIGKADQFRIGIDLPCNWYWSIGDKSSQNYLRWPGSAGFPPSRPEANWMQTIPEFLVAHGQQSGDHVFWSGCRQRTGFRDLLQKVQQMAGTPEEARPKSGDLAEHRFVSWRTGKSSKPGGVESRSARHRTVSHRAPRLLPNSSFHIR